MFKISVFRIVFIIIITVVLFSPSSLFARFFVEGGFGYNLVTGYKKAKSQNYPSFPNNINNAGYGIGLGYETKYNLSFIIGTRIRGSEESEKYIDYKEYSREYSGFMLSLLAKYSPQIVGKLYGNLGLGVAFNRDYLEYEIEWREQNSQGFLVYNHIKDKEYNNYGSGIALIGLEYKVNNSFSVIGNYEYNIAFTKYNNQNINSHYFGIMAKAYLF